MLPCCRLGIMQHSYNITKVINTTSVIDMKKRKGNEIHICSRLAGADDINCQDSKHGSCRRLARQMFQKQRKLNKKNSCQMPYSR